MKRRGLILGGVTLKLDGTTQVTSGDRRDLPADDLYPGFPHPAASKSGYRSQSQMVNVTT